MFKVPVGEALVERRGVTAISSVTQELATMKPIS